MRIVRPLTTPPPAVSENRPAPVVLEVIPSAAPVSAPAPAPEELERFQTKTFEQLQRMESRLDQSAAESVEQGRRNAQDIARLALEIEALKKVIADLPKRWEKPAELKSSEAPPVTKIEELVPMQPAAMQTPKSPAPSAPPSVPADPDKKVALFGKLWNYLNQPE